MPFSYVQGNYGRATGSPSSITVTLPANPGLGNLVCMVIGFAGGTTPTIFSILDSNNSRYFSTPSSPSMGMKGRRGFSVTS